MTCQEFYSSRDVIDKLSVFGGRYEQDAVEYALEHRNEITPKLIELLSFTMRNAESLAEDEGYMGHLYGVFLLAHFREPLAHKVIVELFSLPKRICQSLFEDVITEKLPVILFRTCGGNSEEIKSMVQNPEIYEYCRASAVEALVLGVGAEIFDRQEILAFLASILKERHSEEFSALHDCTAAAIIQLYPAEYLELIQASYDDGYIDKSYVEPSEIEEAMESGLTGCIEKLKVKVKRSWHDHNFHYHMGWWYFFHEKTKDRTLEASFMGPDCFIREFALSDDRYEREVIDEALTRKEELTPYLLDALGYELENAESDSINANLLTPVYAVILLAHFREVRAHNLIIKMAMNPKIQEHDDLREVFYELLPLILLRTSGHDFSEIKELILNPAVSVHSRSAAVEALSMGVAQGHVERAGVVVFLKGLLEKRHIDQGRVFIMTVVGELIRLCPVESSEQILMTIEEGFFAGFKDEAALIREELDRALNDGEKICLENFRLQIQDFWNDDDIHSQMGWWHTHYGEDKREAYKKLYHLEQLKAESANRKKKKMKSLKKMKKASKTQNRKKKR
jgi:hypothetical protein